MAGTSTAFDPEPELLADGPAGLFVWIANPAGPNGGRPLYERWPIDAPVGVSIGKMVLDSFPLCAAEMQTSLDTLAIRYPLRGTTGVPNPAGARR